MDMNVMDLPKAEYYFNYNDNLESPDEDDSEEELGFEKEAFEPEPDNVYPCRILTVSEITKQMTDTIDEVNLVLQLAPTAIRLLLTYFKWDKEKLLERFYEEDQDTLFQNAGIVKQNQAMSSNSPSSNSNDAMEECGICLSEFPNSEMYGLGCGHRFCNICWTSYLTSQIMWDGLAQIIPCPHSNCKIFVDSDTVNHFVTDPATKDKYQRLLINSYVRQNRLICWCPSPADCPNAISVQSLDSKSVTCSCGCKICFQCGQPWHEPMKCLVLKKWMQKCSDDSESNRWIRLSTQNCPKCDAPIEKNGGCRNMRCGNPDCRHYFLWSREVKMALLKHRTDHTALKRYQFYSIRYQHHMKRLRFQHKLYTSVAAKMELMMQNHMNWVEIQFLKKAADTLCQCRQTLMYTYGFAFYYYKQTNKFIMFVYNQREFKQAIKTLSRMLENEENTADDVMELKHVFLDKTTYCESRKKILVDHVQEGYDNGWWSRTIINISK